jgi:hypothetical protein
MEDIPTAIRVVTQLEEEGCQHAADVAFRSVLKVKVVESHERRPSLSHRLDVFNNGGAYQNINTLSHQEM